MKHSLRLMLAFVGCALLTLSISSCGSGGSSGGGTTPSAASPAQTIVSGTVQAPGGQIAFFKKQSFGDVFVSEAYAALTGLAYVPDNTIVQLARLGVNATSFNVLSTTTTLGGRYFFNLSELGLQPANDLIVRVAGPSGKEIRAFVVGSVADLSPVSEAAYQLTTQSLNGGPLSNLTLQEISDIAGAVGLVAELENIGNASSIDQAVALVKTAVGSNGQVAGFITAAATAGQTTQGTGDVGNFFPFEQGNIWRYNGTRTVVGPTIAYENTVHVSGQGPAPGHGVVSTIFSQTNAEGENRAEKSYHVNGPFGITSYGNDDPADDLTRQLTPFQAVHFPLAIGSATLLEERTGLDWGVDEDGDGRNETFTLRLLQFVDLMESVTVPAGTFPNALKITQGAGFLVTFTTGGNATLIQFSTAWHVSGVGMVKQHVKVQVQGEPAVTVLTEELLSYIVNGQGGGLRIQVSPPTTTLSINETLQLQATAFDQNNLPFPGLSFVWTSSDSGVASVDQNGLVRGNSVGSASITASLGNLVSNTVPATVKEIQLLSLINTNFGNVNDLVYDKTRQRIYASISTNGGVRANTITEINPFNGTIGSSIPVGLEPTLLAMSDDDRYLYVSLDHEFAVRRIDLTTMTPDLKFAVGGIVGTTPADYSETFKASDIKVLPRSPQSVAIARYGQRFPAQRGIAIYDNGVQRPVTTPFSIATDQPLDQVGPNLLAFSSSANTLYGLNWESNQGLFTMAVSSSGVSVTKTQLQHRQCGGSMSFDQNKLYVSSEIVDPVTLLALNIFPLPNPCGEAVTDFTQGRVYFLTRNSSHTPIVLSFNNSTFQLESSADLSFIGLQSVGNLIRWGPDGLAFTAFPGKIYIFRTSLLQ